MNFLQPLFLAGLLAIALPLLIHLINRKKAVTRPFPAMRLLLESNEKIARSVKVRQWVLLALRMLAIAVLVFALAKPYMLSSGGITAEERLPTAVVLVVENGFAMDHSDWWTRAQREATSQVGGLRPWDEVALLTTTERSRTGLRLNADHAEVRRQINHLSRSDEAGDLGGALIAAADLLAGSQFANRRIIVVGSGTRSSLADARRELQLRHPIEFVSVRPGDDDATTNNLAVVDVEYRQEGSAAQAQWIVDAVVQNFGTDDRSDLRVQLQIGESVVGGTTVDVPAQSQARVSFLHRLEETDTVPAMVQLIDADDLYVDDTWHFLIRPRGQVRALLVNGSPSTNPLQDELFFLTRALQSSAEGAQISASVTTFDGLSRRDLSDFDVVVLANVNRHTQDSAEQLRSFVEDGGGLFITMGDEIDPESYNNHLGDLLPRPLRGMKRLAERDDPDAPIKITRPGQPQRQHPIFQVFGLPGGASLQSVSVFSYMLLDPAPSDRDSRILLAFQDNAPALLERQHGQGRVLLWTTTIDRDWSDFPIRTAYLPTVHRTILYLARRATSAADDVHSLGSPLRIEVGDLARERAILSGPGNARLVEEIQDGVATFHPTRAGVYQFYADREEDRSRVDSLSVAVNLDRRGSDLSPFPPNLIDQWQRDEEGTLLVDAPSGEERRVNLWSYFLFFVTMALLAETILGSRRSVLTKTWDRLRFWKS